MTGSSSSHRASQSSALISLKRLLHGTWGNSLAWTRVRRLLLVQFLSMFLLLLLMLLECVQRHSSSAAVRALERHIHRHRLSPPAALEARAGQPHIPGKL